MKNFTKTIVLLLITLCSLKSFSLPILNSYPTATATIFLDFDGQTVTSSLWNSGSTILCAPVTLSDLQIEDVFKRVAEDFRPFDINITTDSTVFFAAPINKRIRIIVTPTSSWKPTVGGVSFTGSFKWGDNTPGFVFSDRLSNNTKYIADCCSHESGHTLGLSHQAKYDANCTLIEPYSTGYGAAGDQTSWAPIMGSSYSKNISTWHNGATPSGCTSLQDNLNVITSSNNISYRPDDFSDTLNEFTYVPENSSTNITSTNNFTLTGNITTGDDKDAFKLIFDHTKRVNLSVNPYSVGANNEGANLDVKIMIYDEAKNLICIKDPKESMSVNLDTILEKGYYYVVIDGVGNNNMTDYASVGTYTFNCSSSKIAIRSLALTGAAGLDGHNLHWDMENPEAIAAQSIEISADGVVFTTITNTNIRAKDFHYNPNDNNIKYYRIRITSISDETVYSNVVSIKPASIGTFKVNTLVQNQITVNASENYQYKLLDINGRVIATGNGIKGMNNINMYNASRGMYVIQFYGATTKSVERIIKQ
jgi:hypothetical protein